MESTLLGCPDSLEEGVLNAVMVTPPALKTGIHCDCEVWQWQVEAYTLLEV